MWATGARSRRETLRTTSLGGKKRDVKKNDKWSVRSVQKTRPGGKGKGGAGCKARPGKGKRQKMKNRKASAPTLVPFFFSCGSSSWEFWNVLLLLHQHLTTLALIITDILSEKMPSVSVKDVSQQEFTMALAAFQRSKLIPSLCVVSAPDFPLSKGFNIMARWRCQSGSTWWRLTSGWFSIPVLACSIFLNLNFNKNNSSRKELAPYDED